MFARITYLLASPGLIKNLHGLFELFDAFGSLGDRQPPDLPLVKIIARANAQLKPAAADQIQHCCLFC